MDLFDLKNNRKIWAQNILFCGLAVLASGFFLIDKSAHRAVMYIFLIAGLFLTYRKEYFYEVLKEPAIRLLMGFFAFLLLSTLWSSPVDWERAMTSLKGGVLGFCFSYVIFAMSKEKPPLKYLHVLGFAFIVGCLISVVISYSPALISGEKFYRLGLIFRGENPNIAGFLIGISILLTIWIYTDFQTITKKSWPSLLLLLFLTVALIITQSRSVFIALIITLLSCLIMARSYKLIPVLGIIVCICAAISIVFINGAFSSILDRGDNYRFEVWGYGFEALKQQPLIGRGAAEVVNITYNNGQKSESSVHSIFLGVAMDTGIIGLLLFFGAAFLLLRDAFILFLRREATLPFALLVYGFSVGIFEFHSYFVNLNREWLVWWLPLGMILAAKHCSIKNGGPGRT